MIDKKPEVMPDFLYVYRDVDGLLQIDRADIPTDYEMNYVRTDRIRTFEQPSDESRARVLDRPYGPFYKLKNAAKLLRDVDKNGGLCQGGEQYPNGICCLDAAADIDKAEKEIRSALTAQKPAAAVDLEALKSEMRKYFFDAFHPDYESILRNHRENVIDYLHAQGMLTQPKGRG